MLSSPRGNIPSVDHLLQLHPPEENMDDNEDDDGAEDPEPERDDQEDSAS